jgi:hypothetical protein
MAAPGDRGETLMMPQAPHFSQSIVRDISSTCSTMEPIAAVFYGFRPTEEHLFENKSDLRVAIEPLLEARHVMRKRQALLDQHLSQIDRKDEGLQETDDNIWRWPDCEPKRVSARAALAL